MPSRRGIKREPITPDEEFLQKAERENPNASPAAKYRLAQVYTLLRDVERYKNARE